MVTDMVLVLILLLALILPTSLSGQESAHENNKTFWALSVTASAMTIADIEITKYRLRNMRGFIELNPLMGHRPSRSRMYATDLGIQLGLNLLARRLKDRGHRRLWKAMFITSIAANSWCIQRNLRLRENPGWKAIPR